METENTQEKLDLFPLLRRFFKSLGKLWIIVVLLAGLGAGAMFFRAWRSYTPMYESKAIFSVNSGYSVNDIFINSYYYDTAAAEQLASAFPALLNTDIMRDLIMAETGKSYINGTIIPSSVADTNMFELAVRSNDPQDAYDILCAVIECYPQVAVYMVDNPQMIIRQSATLPTEPYNSFSGLSSAVKGGLLGLLLGLAIVALHALMSRTVLDAEELKKLINLPILATFPHVEPKQHRKASRTFLNADDDRTLAEALRSLRTKIHKQLDDKQSRVVLLTSTIPAEGKSTIAANLAISLAEEGRSVVLVDADLRNQTVYRMFSAGQSQMGLMDCLKDPRLAVMDCLSSVPGTNLYYLSGASTNKRHYSIDAKAMRRVLEELTAQFEFVIVDSPPCTIVSDTALLGRYADCVLYVVRQDHANQAQILDGVTGLYQQDLPLTGCILNDAPRRHIRYGYGYGYGAKKRTT